MPDAFVFTRLYLPRPIESAVVEQLLTRLAGSDVARPISVEVRATDDDIQHILGCAPTAVHHLKHLVRGAIPHIEFGAAARGPVAWSGRIRSRRTGLPLSVVDPEQVQGALYGVLASRKPGETVVLQVVLGSVRWPAHIRRDVPDPHQPVGSRLWRGVRSATPATTRRLSDHAATVRLATTVRIGVDGTDPARRAALAHRLFAVLQPLQSAGVTFQVRREPSVHLDRAVGVGRDLDLTPAELVPLLGLPLGEQDYPGIDPLHPKRLPVPKDVSRTEGVFAVGTAPGPGRPIGFEPRGRLQHSVAIGPTGSGKSVLLEHLILSDVAAQRPCVVIEPKRQLVDSILDRVPSEAAGQIVVVDAADPHPVGFNPLDLSPDDDPYVVADNILAALAAIFQDGWGPRTEYLIQGALVTLLLAGQRRGLPFALIDLPLLLTDAPLRLEAVTYVSSDPALAAFWSEFEEMPVRQRVNQIAAPLNKLRKLVMRRNLVAVLGQPRPRFRLQDVFKGDKTVLVPLNEALLGRGAAQLLGSLMVAALWTATLGRAAEAEPSKRPGMIFVDEVQNYLHLPTDVGDAMATSRSYGVAWHVAHQYRAQLPAAMRAGFDTNARAKFVFALGPDDARDLAKHAPDLTAEDFQRLGKYETYSRLVQDGAPTDWFSARTLAPAPVIGSGKVIRDASRELYGMQPRPTEEPPPAVQRPAENATTTAPMRPRGQKARRS